jgi:hypothetical protein
VRQALTRLEPSKALPSRRGRPSRLLDLRRERAEQTVDRSRSRQPPGDTRATPKVTDSQMRFESIVDALGFDPVDSGQVSESWRQPLGTPVYGK